jgi:MFS-type transporter involved in bile tolerance (Atg22 family)
VNKITFIICIVAAIFTLLNGVLTKTMGFADIKEKIFIATIIVIFAFRYIYIARKCNGR